MLGGEKYHCSIPPLLSHISPLLCLRPLSVFPSSARLSGALPNQLEALWSTVSSPAGPGGARPTNGSWRILTGKSLSPDNTIGTFLLKFRGRTMTKTTSASARSISRHMALVNANNSAIPGVTTPKIGEYLSEMWPNYRAKFHADR